MQYQLKIFLKTSREYVEEIFSLLKRGRQQAKMLYRQWFVTGNTEGIWDIPNVIQKLSFKRIQSADFVALKMGFVLFNTIPFSTPQNQQLSIPFKTDF